MDKAKIVFFLAIALILVVGGFGVGLWSGKTRNGLYDAVDYIVDSVREVVRNRENLAGWPGYFMQPARQPGDGVTINEVDDDSLVLVAGFFRGEEDGPAIRLLDRDGTILAHWQANYTDIFPDVEVERSQPNLNWQFDLHGLLTEPSGAIIFNFEYNGTAKLDRCGEVVWRLPRETHHSLARAEDGSYWILDSRNFTRDDPEAFFPFSRYREVDEFREDTLIRVSPDGEVLGEWSIPRLFMQNKDLEATLTAAHSFFEDGRAELTHSNKVDVLRSEWADRFPDFEAGDLLISFRRLNALMVVDPDDMSVKWLRTGPWLRQHDSEFTADGKISMFNNNAYPVIHDEWEHVSLDEPRTSEITEYDPLTDTSVSLYGNRPGQEFLSVYRGDHQRLENGNIFISEPEAGRLFEVTPDGRIVWEFINRYNEDSITEMTDAQVYPRDYFQVDDWSCP